MIRRLLRWLTNKMSDDVLIGAYMGRWTDNEKSFVGLTAKQANCFLRFGYDWMLVASNAGGDLDDEYRRLDAMRETIISFDADDQ